MQRRSVGWWRLKRLSFLHPMTGRLRMCRGLIRYTGRDEKRCQGVTRSRAKRPVRAASATPMPLRHSPLHSPLQMPLHMPLHMPASHIRFTYPLHTFFFTFPLRARTLPP